MIFLLHIPKTGGSYVFKQLAKHGPAHNVGPAESPTLSAPLPACWVARAHCDMTLVRALPTGTQVITILRDPIQRIESLFDHAHFAPDHPLYAYAQDGFEAFIQAALPYRPCDNEMTRRLAGIYYTGAKPSHHHVQVALENLEHCYAVGFQAMLTKLFKTLAERLGIELTYAPAEHKRPLNYHTRLLARNALDVELYMRACARYA